MTLLTHYRTCARAVHEPDYQAENQIEQKFARYNIIAIDGVPTKQ